MRDTYEALDGIVRDNGAEDTLATIANILREMAEDGDLSDEDAATLAKLEAIGYIG